MKIFTLTYFVFYLIQDVFSRTPKQQQCIDEINSQFQGKPVPNPITPSITKLSYVQYAILNFRMDRINDELSQNGISYYNEISRFLTVGRFMKDIFKFCQDRAPDCAAQIKTYLKKPFSNNFHMIHWVYENVEYRDIHPHHTLAQEYLSHLSCTFVILTRDAEIPELQTPEEYCDRIHKPPIVIELDDD